ncbi:hypothetical protein EZS27_035629 [termite gut metagenome]|uniref:6-bladed beta-propeller n=1 Tax=termite gut metagenome TaxID=433724 RepID=A0A5J4PVX1_9ZZZZ
MFYATIDKKNTVSTIVATKSQLINRVTDEKNSLFIALILVGVLGCTPSKTIEDNSTVLTLASDIKRDLVDTVYFKSSQFIFLETNDNSLLREITRICNHAGKLFIFDKSLDKIVFFDMEGKYLNHIHRIGNAPSEYISLMDFCLDTIHSQILVLCDRPYKIMKFNYSGDFIGEKQVNDLYFNIIAHSGYVYCNKSELSAENQDNYELLELAEKVNEDDNPVLVLYEFK